MRWIKTMRVTKSILLLAVLMNLNLLVNATPSTLAPTLVTAITANANNATNITVGVNKASSFNNIATQATANRERSAKISSDRIKDSLKNEENSTPSLEYQPRRTGIGRVRDTKLMSILQARRRMPVRWKSKEDCERNCTSNNDEYCKLKCNRDMKLVGERGNKNSESVSETRDEMILSKMNLEPIVPEEFLDTGESVQGLYFAEPGSNSTFTKQTKESSNHSNRSSSRNIFASDDKKRNWKDKLISDLTSAASLSTTTELVAKLNRRNKYTRTSFPPSESRSPVYRGRVKFSPSNLKTLEEMDAYSYSHIGQRISSPPTRVPEIKRKLHGKRTLLPQSTTPSRSEEEELEIMEVSVAKQSSTEKNKFWKTRNVVAINNYMKRLNPHTSNSSVEGEPLKKLTTVKYETVHTNPVRASDSMTAVTNIDEGIETIKNIFSRSTSNSSRVKIPDRVPTKSFNPELRSFLNGVRMPSLIINVPDDATPVFSNEARPSDVNLQSFSEDDSETIETTTSLITIKNKLNNETELHDDHSESVTTTNDYLESRVTQKSLFTIQATFPSITLSTAVIESSTSPIEPSAPIKTTKRVYTTIPRRKTSTTVYPDYNRTTISTFLSNISSRRTILNGNSEKRSSLAPAETTPSTLSYYTTTPVSDAKSTSLEIEVVVPSSEIPESVTSPFTPPARPPTQSDIFEKSVTSTSKTVNNEVYVEMYQLNTATYVMAGLGLLPLVVILICVTRQYLYRQSNAKSSECYGNDIQPISPIVVLDQSDESVDSNEEESTISEADFNRSNLRFKSLLGEGNFGQVWKAEADNLMGHDGTTRIIAVKTERSNNGQGGLKSECEIMRRLGSHSNVVTLLGACVDQEPHLLLMEYAMRGRLLSLLRAARGVLNGLHHSPSRQPVMPLSPRRLTGFALDIAKGMEYIAEKKIVHRDLAARNVLLDHNGVCKICDFGMSVDLSKVKPSQRQLKIPRVPTHQNKFKFDMTASVFSGLKLYASSKSRNDNESNKIRPALPIRWMAPEALQYHIYSVETDVFAFGIVLWELSTLGITPYPTLTGREVLRNVPNGVRPEIPTGCRQELSDTMMQCWHKDPNHRPSFTESKNNLARALLQWQEDSATNTSEYIDVSGFSEDYENGMIYFNRRVSEFECEI